IAGHRLAWQWGRLIGMLAAVLYLLVTIVTLSTGIEGAPPAARFIVAALAMIMSAGLVTIAVSFGTRSAKLYFDLRCPRCGEFTSSAADFFFNTAKCKKCDKRW